MRLFTILASGIMLMTISTAQAEDPVRIVSGGPTTAAKLKPIEQDIEKAIGAQIEITVNPIDAAMIAVSKGIVDGVTGAVDEVFASAEKRGGIKLNRADYQWLELSKNQLHAGVHPDNPVKNLSKEQITDILSGKIKSWEPITGEKLPITILIPKNYVGSMKSLTQYYIKSDTSAAAQYVMNKDGLLSGMKNNRGAIGFFTNMETRADFSPKFFQLEVANVSALIMKKPARPAAQKLLDYLKAHPDLLANK